MENRLILAPMGGMLRPSVRLTYRRLGAAMTCIGVIDARAVARAESDELINILGRREVTYEEERPVSVQLIGANVDEVAAAANRIQRFASVIDLNCSGPLQRLIDQGYGAADLLRDPAFIKEMVHAVVERTRLPITVKIRIGMEGPDVDVVGIAQNCQEAGAAAIAVHARFVRQMYFGPAHWEWIKTVKENVDIPVVGNGAVHSAFDAQAMLERTGCDFVMIGTGAFINPLIFLQTNELLETGHCPTISNTRTLLRFFREYFASARRMESRGLVRFLRSSCKNFLKVRSFMQGIQSGRVTLK
ncbi:tRNA-dihydrouridine synthase family protein [Anaerobaca lacustris]|uniref:tRNA-dihydrouridine synthase n=1 Tax=Anaerobaca lacustris TaxID=3044600 RepID=A0AAW6TVI5_9BACT|nr:tRNA-dihydrouridine synthase family protein [Sedimentisphaerales bacterium M17dextr]